MGDYVRFQSNVFVGKKTTIGNFVWVLPYVVLTNDPTPPSNVMLGCTIEDYASIAAASVVLPGVTIGHQAFIVAQACVTRDVPPNMVAAGVPARVVGEAKISCCVMGQIDQRIHGQINSPEAILIL